MKVYLDYVFIENLIINISILYQTSIFTKIKVKWTRLILVSNFLSIISIVKAFEIGNSMLINILSLNIAIYVLYKPNNVIKYIKLLMYYFLIYNIYIGIIISTTIFLNIKLDQITIRIILYIVSIFVTYIINKYMWKIWINKIKYNNLTYKVVLCGQDNISFKVFVDTGNSLKDPFSNLDVIVLNSKAYKRKYKKITLDSIKKEVTTLDVLTATGKSKIKGYIFSNVSIKKGGIEKVLLKKAIIVFIDEEINNNQYDGIISYNTYLEKLEGVII